MHSKHYANSCYTPFFRERMTRKASSFTQYRHNLFFWIFLNGSWLNSWMRNLHIRKAKYMLKSSAVYDFWKSTLQINHFFPINFQLHEEYYPWLVWLSCVPGAFKLGIWFSLIHWHNFELLPQDYIIFNNFHYFLQWLEGKMRTYFEK